MKDEELKGMPVKVKDPRDGTVYDCFVAQCDRGKGLTVKLLDPADNVAKWRKEDDGSVNMLCLNKKEAAGYTMRRRRKGSEGYLYKPCFDYLVKAIGAGDTISLTFCLEVEGLMTPSFSLTGRRSSCAFS